MNSAFRILVGFLCLSALSFTRNLAVDRGVPVLMWSNDGSLTFPSTLAGHTVSQSDFRQQYVNKLLADNDVKTVAVFVQDKLSVAEISLSADVYSETGDGGAFKQTKDLITNLPSAYLSSVSSPSSVLSELGTDFPGKTYTLQQPFNLADLMVSSEEKKLVLVHLPEHHGSGAGLANYIHHIDAIISNVTSQLEALPGRFAALYTGIKSRGLNAYEQHSGRHLLGYGKSNNQTGLVVSVGSVFLMYTSKIVINYNENKNHTELSVETNDWNYTSGADCPHTNNITSSNVSCTITLQYQKDVAIGDVNLKNLNLIMTYTVSSGIEYGYWYLKKFLMTYQNSSTTGDNPVTVVLDSEFVAWTPFKFSYHCHHAPPIRPKKNSSESDAGLTLSFKAFQVQTFYVGNGFGYYNDCIGFFTIPIWSAIICSAVLIAILFFGVIMLMSIKTPDRMDDAKGKTISVTVSE